MLTDSVEALKQVSLTLGTDPVEGTGFTNTKPILPRIQ
jgi:hypothetical protein